MFATQSPTIDSSDPVYYQGQFPVAKLTGALEPLGPYASTNSPQKRTLQIQDPNIALKPMGRVIKSPKQKGQVGPENGFRSNKNFKKRKVRVLFVTSHLPSRLPLGPFWKSVEIINLHLFPFWIQNDRLLRSDFAPDNNIRYGSFCYIIFHYKFLKWKWWQFDLQKQKV